MKRIAKIAPGVHATRSVKSDMVVSLLREAEEEEDIMQISNKAAVAVYKPG